MKIAHNKPLLCEFVSYSKSVPKLLNAIELDKTISKRQQILIKPNLVEASPPPITTPVECCEAIVEYVQQHSRANVIIAEGSGAADHETSDSFRLLGYTDMAQRMGISLVDLNHAPITVSRRNGCDIFPEMRLPSIAFESYIISVPVLKAHSLAKFTGTLKNMMGFAPPAYYQCGGHWKKAAFHHRLHESLIELNRYVTPHFTLLDASVGLAEHHLGGAECNPPVCKLLAGFDPIAVDREAAGLLGLNWREIPHLQTRRTLP